MEKIEIIYMGFFKKIFYCFVVSLFFSTPAMASWQNPPGGTTPPNNNIDTPINVGSVTQTKTGGLNIGGNVGIGTVSPSSKLQVDGLTNIRGMRFGSLSDLTGSETMWMYDDLSDPNTRTGYFGIRNDGFLQVGLEFMENNSGSSGEYFKIKTGNGADRFFINYNGNIGIASTSPNYLLSLDGLINGTRMGIGTGRIKGLSVVPLSDDEAASKYYVDSLNSSTWVVSGNNIYNANSGNVGIGTNNPTQKLDINGGMVVDNNNSGGTDAFYVTRLGQTTQGLKIYATDRDLYTRYIEDSGEPFPGSWHFINEREGAESYEFMTARTNGDVTFTSGNIGIGTSAPTNKLHVSGGDLYVEGGGIYSDYDIGNKGVNIGQVMEIGTSAVTTLRFDSDAYRIYAGGTGGSGEILRVAENGNIGIGTNNPTEKLDVVGDGKFSGDLAIGGQINLGGSDAAEEFVSDNDYPAGTVLVMDDNGFKSATVSSKEYDTKVVGVVSAQASVVMGRVDSEIKSIVAMVGVVPVKVNDSSGLIKKGDLLTTSSIFGEAMKASNPKIGTIIGKALEDAISGHCEVQALINLQ